LGLLQDYLKMLFETDYSKKGEKYIPKNRIYPSDFIGPGLKTLEIQNIGPINPDIIIPNITEPFAYCVTEKADGDRHLLYVNNEGKIYLINMNMNVIFTGAKTQNEECFDCLFDGELILHDKTGKFINLYAAFDIYYYKKDDVRAYPFMTPGDEDIKKSRFYILRYLLHIVKPVSITDVSEKDEKTVKSFLQKYKKSNDLLSPLRIMCKDFYPMSPKQNIFNGEQLITQIIEESNKASLLESRLLS
jgi:hypothetical protein